MPRPKKVVEVKTRRKRTYTRKPKSTLFTGDDPIMQLLIQSIVEKYRNDPSTPSVVVSYIPAIKQYWVSLQRYKATWGQQPFSVFNVKADTLLGALNGFAAEWKERCSPSQKATDVFIERFDA